MLSVVAELAFTPTEPEKLAVIASILVSKSAFSLKVLHTQDTGLDRE